LTRSGQGSKFKKTVEFLSQLGEHQSQRQLSGASELGADMALLRHWQSERLARTHADLLASPRYGPACRFFLENIYASHDFSQRDHDIQYLYGVMSHFLPDFLLALVRNAVEINSLTNALDQALLRALVDELGVTDTITEELYAEGYRICDNYDERAHQIELLVKIGHEVDISTRLPLVGMTLRIARAPARRTGWGDMQDFLERGFNAFKHMHGAGAFLDIIYQREMKILDRIFEGMEDPFEL
jgi:hypothetical protein